MDADDIARYLALATEARARQQGPVRWHGVVALATAVEALAAEVQRLTGQRDHARAWVLFHANAACYFAAENAGLDGTIKRPVTPDIPRKADDGWGI